MELFAFLQPKKGLYMSKTYLVPPMSAVIERLSDLTGEQMRDLGKASGVPVSTLNKIRYGFIKNPGIETVGKFFPLLKAPKVKK